MGSCEEDPCPGSTDLTDSSETYAEDMSIVEVEYSRSRRSRCRICMDNIARCEMRFKVTFLNSTERIFFHLHCLDIRASGVVLDELVGLDTLTRQDRRLVVDRVARAWT
eukprot:NODE_6095_length_531_cov_115.836100_g5338_i0.p1 GENE.NODE_6095_length_531_cov_115.836100_g5338_i0~~NODE_6095_length_531_cov_115.836100_g5338_i0.p1  ORF type:complete len:109 (+),score=6.30 NODE_6095_length_531_cov_115.836100_g5338_i0:31-357(+)